MPTPMTSPSAPDHWYREASWRARFRSLLLAWYDQHARRLPWRQTRDPYRIWVAEILLQQTRVHTARAYYDRFIQRFPDLPSLARADLAEILAVWQGLGYYQRARWLHAAAQILVRERAGRFPERLEELLQLPGLGPYTARAVASIAFHQPVGVVDGNVRRVLARLFAQARPTRAFLQERVDVLVDPTRPGDFNQALMELGARICRARQPHCTACPVTRFCRAARTGQPQRYPEPRSRSTPPTFAFWVGIWTRRSCVLMGRQQNSLLRGFWMLPMWSRDRFARPSATLKQTAMHPPASLRDLPPVRHAFSHRVWILHPFHMEWTWPDANPEAVLAWPEDLAEPAWWPRHRLHSIPVPAAHRKILQYWMRRPTR